MTNPTSSTNGTAGGINRARSVRNGAGTPMSARAAARKPADSDGVLDDAKAELQAKLDELQERLQEAEQACEESQKHAQVLQMNLDDSLKEQGILEESLHEHTERIEDLEVQRKDSVRARRELEQIYETERVATMKEKEEASAKEEEMHAAMQRMKEALAQREMRSNLDDERRPAMSRTSSFRSNNASPNPDSNGQFAPSSSLQRSDSRSRAQIVLQKDKVIESLRLELAEAQIKLVEVENMGGGRQHELEKHMYDTKMQNARLMEENESFQLLLSEKTLNGDFAHSNLLRAESSSGSRPPSSRQPVASGASLADELESQEAIEEGTTSASEEAKGPSPRLQAEVNSLKDQNKALTLYINNIISRLLQHDQFEQILDKTPDLMAGPAAISKKYASLDTGKELPPPPPSKHDSLEEEEPHGFLQRARSVMGAKPRRPMSTVVQPEQAPKIDEGPRPHENPSTAPSIPLGRSNSTRAGGGHRRADSDWPAASVVTNMYRGPSPALQGPASPGLSSPGRGNSFFAPQNIGPSIASRVPSGSTVPTVPTISENEGNQENLHFRDSKLVNPPSKDTNRNSSISNPGASETLDIADAQEGGSSGLSDLSNPSSPPRSTTSSGDRDTRSGGAIMIGSKMRPLRLVQEAAQGDEAAKKAVNRGSWFGWMNKGAGAAPPAGRTISGGEGGQ